MLDDDSLLQIFGHYQLAEHQNWNLRHTWRNLAQVCRRWRFLVFDSWLHLDMCLLLTINSPSMDTVNHLPPLPLVIDYSEQSRTITPKDERNIHLALKQHDRVHRVTLQAPSSRMRVLLEPMDILFPRLEDLSLVSTTIQDMNLMLPETLQAPYLRHLALRRIGLPKGLPLLSSTIALSSLSVTHIGASCYFPPGHLITHLPCLPHLEELTIGFAIPIPIPSSEQELLPPPIPPVTLPALRWLTFRGVDVYLDNLVAQINTPLLERLNVTLEFDLAYTLVNLAGFIRRTEGFECRFAKIDFRMKGGASMDTGHYRQHDPGKLILHVNCKPLDWQIDSAGQVCSALGTVVSIVEELTLGTDTFQLSSDWESRRDNTLWHELLLPFIGLKKLHVDSSLTLELGLALETAAGGSVLPELQEINASLTTDRENEAFSVFVKTRESVGRPVQVPGLVLSVPDVSHAEPEVPSAEPVSDAEPEVPNAGPEVHHWHVDLKYTANSGRLYRSRAMNLISIYQSFMQTQEQTFGSYDELRR